MKNYVTQIFMATLAGAFVLSGCGAKHKNPTKGYGKYDTAITPGEYVPAPEAVPPRVQKLDQCAVTFATEPVFEVIEGGTFKQSVTMSGAQGAAVLRSEPKGMTISADGKTLTYTVPRGTVAAGQTSASFTYSLVPKAHIGKPVQCKATYNVRVSLRNDPVITVSGKPAQVEETSATKFTVFVDVKAVGLKDEKSLTLTQTFDRDLDSAERRIYDLLPATVLSGPIKMAASTYRFALEIDPGQFTGIIAARKTARTNQRVFIFLSKLSANNSEAKTDASENLVINVTRTLPQAANP